MTFPRRHFTGSLVILFLVLAALPDAYAIPAFARKYGLRCSACHEAWPMLNYFGQKFKDNGYQLMNDRDSPIWQNPSYWPATLRITPFWHRESTDKVQVDAVTGSATSASVERQLTIHGFDNSGLDILTAGTLEKNVSFLLVPSSDEIGAFHMESANVRLDNLLRSPWLNVKMGKFELDNLISEKRTLTLSGQGGAFQMYHFIPQGDGNIFGQIGDNQLGLEWMGHSVNDRTRISAALMSSTDGNPDLTYGRGAYSGFFAASQAFDLGKLGVDRIGGYAMVGQAPTTFLTLGGAPLPSTGLGYKSFHREGFVGLFYFGKLDFLVMTQHGWDDAFFGQGYGDLIDGVAALNNIPGTNILPATARAPTWNAYMVETHFVYNPQLVFIQRSEWDRMSQQPSTTFPGNFGDIDNYVFGLRWYPIMNPRAGFAIHNEYAWLRQRGTAPVSGTDLTSSSVMIGFDFDF